MSVPVAILALAHFVHSHSLSLSWQSDADVIIHPISLDLWTSVQCCCSPIILHLLRCLSPSLVIVPSLCSHLPCLSRLSFLSVCASLYCCFCSIVHLSASLLPRVSDLYRDFHFSFFSRLFPLTLVARVDLSITRVSTVSCIHFPGETRSVSYASVSHLR